MLTNLGRGAKVTQENCFPGNNRHAICAAAMFPGKHRCGIKTFAGTSEFAKILVQRTYVFRTVRQNSTMTNDVAVFLDLDNLVIGAKQINLTFDINLVLEHVKLLTDGRVVLRQAYGAGKQSQRLLKELAQAGFVVQSASRINNFSKNLADMQIAVNAMDTLVDGHQYNTYVLMSGDRDFTPLVQSLRKRGKYVIGVGIKHTTSGSLVELCDEYLFYEDLLPAKGLTEAELEELVAGVRDALLADKGRVRASIFKQRMTLESGGRFNRSAYPQSSFSKFLESYPHLVRLFQEETTAYVSAPQSSELSDALHLRYRAALKKQRLRVVPSPQRFAVLRELVDLLKQDPDLVWHQVLSQLHTRLAGREDLPLSKSQINGVLLMARQAGLIRTLKGSSLSTAPVVAEFNADHAFQEAVVSVDNAYMQAILALSEPFDLTEAALALYDSPAYAPYLGRIANN